MTLAELFHLPLARVEDDTGPRSRPLVGRLPEAELPARHARELQRERTADLLQRYGVQLPADHGGIAGREAGHRLGIPMPRRVSPSHARTIAVALAALIGAPAARGQTVVTGTVYDSVTTTPLAGAIVQLAAQDDPKRVLTASADSLGRYRIEGVRPGRYLAGFLHPTLDVLGLDASRRVRRDPGGHLAAAGSTSRSPPARGCPRRSAGLGRA